MVDPDHPGADQGRHAGRAPVGVGIVHGETFTYVSEELAAIAAEKRRLLVGATWDTLIGPDEATRLQAAVDTTRSEGRWQGEVTLDTPDGATPVTLDLSAIDGDRVLVTVSPRELSFDADIDRGHGRNTDFYNRPLFVRSVVDALEDILYVIDDTGESFFWNEALLETTGYTHAEIDAMHPMDLVPEDQHKYVPGLLEAIDSIEDRRMEIDIVTADGTRIPHEFRGTSVQDPATGASYRCGLARDVTERNARERKLERQRDELATLDRINGLVLETVTDLMQRTDREAVEQRVCERLAESEFYRFAWIGEPEVDGHLVRPRVTAGDGAGYLEDVVVTTDDAETGQGTVGRAIRQGVVQVATVDDPAFGPWAAAARERGFEAVAAVPLQHTETVYGVLVVYATREAAFTEREQAGFDVIGRAVGAVINATRNHELLFAEDLVEMDLDITNVDVPIVRTATRLEGELSLDGQVATDDGWIVYWSLAGARPAKVAEVAAADPDIDDARVIAGGDGRQRIEVVQSDACLLEAVAHAGGVVQSGFATPSSARLTIEVPAAGDVRDIVHEIRREHPATRLLAQRERERTPTPGGTPDGVLDELTDRQRETIEVAYRAGYFAWPRESSAEEVADSLGLSAATVHGHLRKAEETILAELLDRG